MEDSRQPYNKAPHTCPSIAIGHPHFVSVNRTFRMQLNLIDHQDA